MEANQAKPKLTGYAILVTIFLFLLVIKLFAGSTLSWWWVTMPIWIAPAAYIGMLVFVFFKALLSEIKERFFQNHG